MFHMFWFTWYGGYEHVPYRAEVVQGPGAAPETSAVVPHAASTVAIRPSAMLRAKAAGISFLPLCASGLEQHLDCSSLPRVLRRHTTARSRAYSICLAEQ